ncbi:spore protease YyaC [Longirhabdus pacifica]|uniref:spore protease YyaC n=1 Tax=Longirhabdus pacifica TaxID=2305227 RepID=UPI001008CADB|nr:spore protease YyaC [Longirhabdus pacifica]
MDLSLFRLPSKKEIEPFKIDHSLPKTIEEVEKRMLSHLLNVTLSKEIIMVCIGSDRSTGDCLGPLVGSQLKSISSSVPVYGTLEDPIHAVNLEDKLNMIHQQHPHSYIIAIDACLGQISSIGHIIIGQGPIKPGAGVKKKLPPVGHMHITGVVNVAGFMEIFVLQNTRLHLVINIANVISESLIRVIHQLKRSTPSYTSEILDHETQT